MSFLVIYPLNCHFYNIYTLSFLVIYPLNCHFYKCKPNTQLFQKALFNSFYQTLSFLKKHFFIMYFLKTPLFHYAHFQKAEPNYCEVETNGHLTFYKLNQITFFKTPFLGSKSGNKRALNLILTTCKNLNLERVSEVQKERMY